MRRCLFYSFLIFLAGCVEPYLPPVITGEVDIMVVDGFINSTDNIATVHLSHASALSSSDPSMQESNASVSIEDGEGNIYLLSETEPGSYTQDISVDQSKKYRLHVRTSKGQEYFSDYIELTTAPEIDSVTWKGDDDGINIFVNSHDLSGQVEYYSWSYEETWEYIASFYSTYKMVNGEAFERPVDERIYNCWKSERSTSILVTSSVRLSSSVIRDFPITFVQGKSMKLSQRYSILVEQRALTKEAYDFWTQLEKTTESLGGLFDPMPSQVLGNIRSNNAGETVLGYFGGGHVSQKRLFIPFADLPDHILRMKDPAICDEEDVSAIYLADLPTTPNSTLLIDPIYVRGVGIVGYTTARPLCVDCREQGGTTKRPDYW